MASGNTLCVFMPGDKDPGPATLFAPLSTRNEHPTLEYDTTTSWSAIWSGVMPQNYANTTGITVYVHWLAATATSGTIGWLVALENMSDGTNLNADSFASNQTITAATVPGTSGVETITNVAITKGANMDSVVAGNGFRIRISRDVANDTATGNAQIIGVEIRET